MHMLTPKGQAVVAEMAARHALTATTVTNMLVALQKGGGQQAQFNEPELGGMGQWSMGGMTMVGDMFNNGLKARVDALCCDLADVLASTEMFRPATTRTQSISSQMQTSGGQQQSQGIGGMGMTSLFVPVSGLGQWWPEDLGAPGSTGAQNDMKYAYFPAQCRLAILLGGKVTVYDTGPHQIAGFGQQQSGDQSLTFTGQHGLVRVADLPVVGASERLALDTREHASAEPVAQVTSVPAGEPRTPPETPPETPLSVPATPPQTVASALPAAEDSDAIFAKLERLGDLRDKGILTDEEFTGKKKDLLARL